MVKIETEDLLADLRRVVKELDKTPSLNEYEEHGEYSNWTITNRFGSWNEAMSAIGEEPNKRKTKIDMRDILADLKYVSDEIGKTPLKKEYQEHGKYSTSTFDQRFESWEAALDAIGQEPCTSSVRIERQDLLNDLNRVASQLERTPKQTEYDKYGEYSSDVFCDRFGSWNDAITAIGRKPNSNLSRENLLTDLKDVAKKLEKSPTMREYDKHGKYSSKTFYNKFDSWSDAIISIGKKPNSSRKKSPISYRIKKEDLLEDLSRVANDLERAPRRREYVKKGNFAASTLTDRFGSWNDAITAIGEEPNPSQEKLKIEHLLKDLAQVANKIDDSPTLQEYDEYGKYSSSTILTRFDSWNDALLSIGREPNKNVGREYLLADLNRVASELNKAPTKREYNRHGEYSSPTIYKEMGSWEDALVAIDEKPHHNGTRVDSEDLLEDLNRVCTKLGNPPKAKNYNKHGKYCYSTFRRRFGSWTDSLLAIGETPYIHRPPKVLVKHIYEQAAEEKIGRIHPFFANRLDFSPSLYTHEFETEWKAMVRAGVKPPSAVPLSNIEYEAFIDTAINFGDPIVSIYGLIRAFTGIPIQILTEFNLSWVSRVENDIQETLLTVPAEYLPEDDDWVMVLPTHYTAKSGKEKPTKIDSLLAWIDEDEIVSPKSQEGIDQRIAEEANIQVEGSEMRATIASHLIRQGASKGAIEMQVGSRKTNWVRSVEDYMMYMYQFEDYQHSSYDLTGVFLDPETGEVRE